MRLAYLLYRSSPDRPGRTSVIFDEDGKWLLEGLIPEVGERAPETGLTTAIRA
jgi:hypothetical protein